MGRKEGAEISSEEAWLGVGFLGTGRGSPLKTGRTGHGKGQQGTEGRTQERLPSSASPRGAQRGGRAVTEELPPPLCSCGGG